MAFFRPVAWKAPSMALMLSGKQSQAVFPPSYHRCFLMDASPVKNKTSRSTEKLASHQPFVDKIGPANHDRVAGIMQTIPHIACLCGACGRPVRGGGNRRLG